MNPEEFSDRHSLNTMKLVWMQRRSSLKETQVVEKRESRKSRS